jgi:hypothetical protein
MKLQNPPQACLDKAQRIEKYLAPPLIASIYAIIAVFWAVLISGLFAALVSASAVNPTPVSVTILAVLALIPSAFGIVAYFLRPKDPASLYITRFAEMWRKPISVVAELCTFKTALLSGDTVSIQVAFYFPASPKAAEMKEQIYTFAYAALSTLCSMRRFAPGKRDIEAAIEPALEMVASDHKLAVLFPNVLGIYMISESYTYEDAALVAAAS